MKSELNEKLSKIDAINEKALYISKAQYDNEYNIYMEIWETLNNCTIYSLSLYPRGIEDVPIDEKEKEKFKQDKYLKYVDAYNKFSNTISKYAPFYKKEFYEQFINLKQSCFRLGDLYKMYEFDVKYNMSFAGARDTQMTSEERKESRIELPKSIDDIKEKLMQEIRDYLLNLQLK